MTAQFFRKYSDIIAEAETLVEDGISQGRLATEAVLDEKAPPGQEGWVKKHKQSFIDQYGKDKGLSVLYATAWNRHHGK